MLHVAVQTNFMFAISFLKDVHALYRNVFAIKEILKNVKKCFCDKNIDKNMHLITFGLKLSC